MNTNITVNSLSFKTPLPKETYIHLQFIANSKMYDTIKIHYLPKQNRCVYSEVFQLTLSNNLNIETLTCEVVCTEFLPSPKTFCLAKKTFHAVELFGSGEKQKTLTLDVSPKNKAYIHLEYWPLKIESIASSLNSKKSSSTEIKLQNWIADVKEDLQKMGEKDIDSDLRILQMGELYQRFIKNLTPVVYSYNFVTDILYWRQPTHTLIFGIGATINILYPSIVLFIVCALTVLNYQQILDYTLQRSFLIRRGINDSAGDSTKIRFRQYKNNLRFIQEFMNLSNSINHSVKQFLKNEDKSDILYLFSKIRAYQVLVMIACLMFPFQQMLLMTLWMVLLKMNPTLWPIFLQFDEWWFSLFELGLTLIHQNINKVSKVQQQQSDIIEPQIAQTLVRQFVVWENERWWLIGGWTKKMMLGERSSYSDAEGKLARSLENFQLPALGWEWTTQWILEKSEFTDADGWMYSCNDFNTDKWSNENNSLKHYIRKRRWIRKCTLTQRK